MNSWDKKRKKIGSILVGVGVLYLCCAVLCYGETDQEEELLKQLELEQVERQVQALVEEDISFQKLVENFLQGKNILQENNHPFQWKKMLIGNLGESKEMFGKILLLILFASLFSSLSIIFQNKQLEETSFYMVYLLLFLTLLQSFHGYMEEIAEKISAIMEFMKVLLPSYHMAVTMASGTITGAAFYQMIMMIIALGEFVMLKLLMPTIRLYILLELVNYLTGEEMLSKMTELLKNCILWTMKSMLGVILGFQLIQRLLSPAMDAWKRTAMGKTVEAIPGVGNLFGGVAEMVLGSAVLIKNCLGASVLVILIIAAVPPVIRLGFGMLFYQLLAAVVQPVTDKRMVGCLHTMGVSIGLLLRLLFTLEIMFTLTIAILAGSLR